MTEATLVRAGTTVAGDIRGARDLVVEGHLTGMVEVDGDLTVGASGVLRGNVRARRVRVLGVVVGTIVATSAITVSDSARIAGDLAAPTIDVDDRAVFRGGMSVARLEAAVAGGPASVLSPSAPVRARPLPRRPPAATLPRVGRTSGRRRT